MLNVKELSKALKQVAEEKGLEPEKVLEVIESSIAAAYKREYGQRGEIIRCKLDQATGELKFWQVKTVVDETTVRFVSEIEEAEEREKEEKGAREARKKGRAEQETRVAEGEEKLPRFNPERHITLEEAEKVKKGVRVGDEVTFPLEPHDEFGRIAAQTAKQVILQKLRESERDSILAEWRDKEGQIVSGAVQRFERGNVFVDLGTRNRHDVRERIHPGRALPLRRTHAIPCACGARRHTAPRIILSRAHPKFVSELFELEVPELAEDAIEIKADRTRTGQSHKNRSGIKGGRC